MFKNTNSQDKSSELEAIFANSFASGSTGATAVRTENLLDFELRREIEAEPKWAGSNDDGKIVSLTEFTIETNPFSFLNIDVDFGGRTQEKR